MRHDVITDISRSTLQQHDLQFIELVKSTEVLPCLKNGIFCKLFLLTAIKSTFTLIKERGQTERGREGRERQGENYSFDEENMRRDLDVMGRVT